MNNSMGWCYIWQYSLISGIIALIEYEMIVSSNVTYFFQLSIWLVGEFMLCSSGQSLENEREAMAISLYMTPWHRLPIKLRSTFCIFLAKMQMPLHLEAKPVLYLNYDFLMKVLKASYTLLMFLQNKSQ
ncbi:uncharacterized protein LOC123684545 [Harmonia axyridis]|uniref:uncharacterized protein LOC123684545 n=1 Tax=Harmonia axyridis TaxID=115357 RepID=UPI001E276496|nr:uncharacterized protein LOC123684545 [Harmonia axyridis]